MKIRLLLGFAAALVSANASASGNEQAFIGYFGGKWAGSATVIKNSIPWHVGCRVDGRPATNRLVIEGNCNLSIISVRIAADITYDPKSGRYTGTYIGSDVGPARVSGRRHGSVVNLAITWPRVINGDNSARMTIENAGGGNLRITTFDNVVVGGPEVLTSDANLRASGAAVNSSSGGAL
jgi:hypothetical protein